MAQTPEESAALEQAGEARHAWNQIAAGYDEFVTPTHLWLGTEGVRRVGLDSGDAFLDVACGSGALTIPAAQAGARVTSVDISPAMVELVVANARRHGLEIDARVMDGHALELEDDAFDASGSQWGVMLFPDLPRGLREMARVTRPGGRVLLHCYGNPHDVEFLGFFVRSVQAVVPCFEGPPPDQTPLAFQVADPEVLRQHYVDAGLADVTIETITETLQFETGKQLWDWCVWSNPVVREILGHLEVTAEQEPAILARMDQLIRERAGASPVARLTNPVHIAMGTVPG